MKIIGLVVHVVLFVFSVMKLASASEQSLDHADWSIDEHGDLVRYITNGEAVHGHQFGFIKRAGNCNRDMLWVSWSSYEKGLEEFEGSYAGLQFRVDEQQFQIEIQLLSVYPLTSMSTIASFTNFEAGEKLISLLEEGRKIDVTIISPEGLANKFDLKEDSFSLDGFAEARRKSRELCELLGKRTG
jgi:hypothetical protein